MNEKAEQAVAALLERALSGVDAATEFSKEQLPEVVNQLLLWEGIKSGLFFLIGVALVVSVPGVAGFFKRRARDARKAYERGESWTRYDGRSSITSIRYDSCVNGGCFAPIVTAALGVVMVACNLTWLQIWIAPKVYLLEYAANIVK